MRYTSAAIEPQPWKPQSFMPVSADVYSDIQQFLIYEALVLDHGWFYLWAGMLSRDLTYKVSNCSGRAGTGLNAAQSIVYGSRESLLGPLECSQPSGALVQSHLPKTRRFVTNISVSFAPCRKDYAVVSYLRVVRTGQGGTDNAVWSAERRDLLRATDRSFAIAQRELLIDSIEPGTAEHAHFL